MAVDKAVDGVELDAGLTSIADAIRTKGGISAQLDFPNGFTDAVKEIETRKPEQAKMVTITQNGIATVTPDGGKVLSSVEVNVNVAKSTDAEDALVARRITSYTNDRADIIGAYTFCFCQNLASVTMQKAKSIEASAFNGCPSLTEVNIPLIKNIASSAFISCGIKQIDLSSIVSLGATVFRGCTKLDTVIIRREAGACTLAATNSFTDTPIASGTGFIYVPDNLVEQYKSATNWAAYADQIKPLSEFKG